MNKKNTLRVKLKAASQEERMQKWKERFQNLLGNSSKDSDKPIIKVINCQLDIKQGQFTKKELNIVLTKIKA